MKWFLLILVIALTAAANIIMRIGMRQDDENATPRNFLESISNVYVAGGIVLLGIAYFAYAFSLKSLPVSIAYPIMAGAVLILVMGFASIICYEPFNSAKACGTLLIIAGIVVLSLHG